jgi:hypothetical protein
MTGRGAGRIGRERGSFATAEAGALAARGGLEGPT